MRDCHGAAALCVHFAALAMVDQVATAVGTITRSWHSRVHSHTRSLLFLYAGVCGPNGACMCDEGWTWKDCSRLDLLPAPSDTSFHGLNVNRSSWGGSVLSLQLPTHGKVRQTSRIRPALVSGRVAVPVQ